MKKKWIILGAAAVCAVLVLYFSGFFYQRIAYRDVKEVRLYAYDHTTSKEVGLTDEEAQRVIRLYNRSRHGGEITGEPCCASYRITIHLTDGSTVTFSDGQIVKPSYGERHRLINKALVKYILELVERYDLPRD